MMMYVVGFPFFCYYNKQYLLLFLVYDFNFKIERSGPSTKSDKPYEE